jgi:hypothetical protein
MIQQTYITDGREINIQPIVPMKRWKRDYYALKNDGYSDKNKSNFTTLNILKLIHGISL